MNIIVAGDGKVGSALVRQLSSDEYNITLIDSNPRVLENTIEQYDVMAVTGNCATMDVLSEAGVEDASKRPAILKEYTDDAHLLKANHWYHIKIESTPNGRTRYWINNECIVDYLDPQPLQQGWFGFRTVSPPGCSGQA